jgi:NAD(P) transhydrogenase subunit alpha
MGNGEWVIGNREYTFLNYQLPITNYQFAIRKRSFSLMTEALIAALFVFVLASFTGFEIINKIPPTLHTPLMSGSNAISGIAVLGAIVASGARETNLSVILGLIAVVLAMVNVVGGFLVTDRMLQMFKKKANG